MSIPQSLNCDATGAELDSLQIRLLGPLDARIAGRRLSLGSTKQAVVLAALALHPGRVVSMEALEKSVWDGERPARPRRALQLYVTRLRMSLGSAAHLIATTPSGYRFDIAPEQTDLGRFDQLVGRAEQAAEQGDLEVAAASFQAALAEWRGEPLGSVRSEALLRDTAPQLLEHRLRTVERYFEVSLALGQHARVVTELAEECAREPLREPLWALFLSALFRCGRRAEALDAYHAIRERLADELGLDPSDQLRTLHAQILIGDTASGRPATTFSPVPRQLPADLAGFSGRRHELAQLDALQSGQATAELGIVVGTAGIGKTTLAVHWARRVADKYPDGQLWINLRGFGPGSCLSIGAALTKLLRSLGVAPAQIPSDPEEQSALFRSLLDGRRMLLVLDNASSAQQVRALLPGAAGCFTLVTSRRQLSGLVATAQPAVMVLDLLSEEESRELIRRRLGSRRLYGQDLAVDDLIALSARLPLALAIVAARAATNPHFELSTLASALRTVGGLERFAEVDPETEIRSVFSWSYQALSEPAARLFRFLGLHPGPDISAAAAAGVVGRSLSEVTGPLRELCDAHLINEVAHRRYALHDLLRAYAAELGTKHDGPAALMQARQRMFDYYLLTAYTGSGALPQVDLIAPDPPSAGIEIEPLGDYHQTITWFTTEHQVLLAVLKEAVDQGFAIHVWQLAWTLTEFLYRRGHWRDWSAVLEESLTMAIQRHNRVEQARCHRGLAYAFARLGQLPKATLHVEHALQLTSQLANPTWSAFAHRSAALVLEAEGRQLDALSHDLEALRLFESIEHLPALARTLNTVGWSYAQLGDTEAALQHCTRALSLLRRLGDRQGEAATWHSLGFAHQHLGHRTEAIDCYSRAADLFRELGDRYKESECLMHLGEACQEAGDLSGARRSWRSASEILGPFAELDIAPINSRLRSIQILTDRSN
ncbi:BTAD domain-containing putative transcriptional regulator [Streptomyces sp. SID13031]|uniref:AfsR/SARP family transcriptional regulator n=1 Tax=Streptomyces sp. SID13031 TaxID=2706046 RepID=UPI0013C71297|nr:BTAD domain-containing putative transcriptional regulator [Streptomyces sp. SID13031]NEA34328.1 tetratricopeptide repeat protein [Streptomyces sp. SID13031]